jgi:cytidine deaminase
MSDVLDSLSGAAQEVSRHAYAPYSRFHVGAALETEDGNVFVGANVENASYGLGRCAEQSAVQAMIAAGGNRRIRRVHVYTEASPPSTPCGACRQVLFEFGPDAEVVCFNHKRETRVYTVRQLLPGAFGPEDLRQ